MKVNEKIYQRAVRLFLTRPLMLRKHIHATSPRHVTPKQKTCPLPSAAWINRLSSTFMTDSTQADAANLCFRVKQTKQKRRERFTGLRFLPSGFKVSQGLFAVFKELSLMFADGLMSRDQTALFSLSLSLFLKNIFHHRAASLLRRNAQDLKSSLTSFVFSCRTVMFKARDVSAAAGGILR